MRRFNWVERHEALTPQGLVAIGPVLARLCELLSLSSNEQLKHYSISSTPDFGVLVTHGIDLPWLDGVRYCAPDPEAPNLWLPTNLSPTFPAELLQRSVIARAQTSPVLLWHDPEVLFPLSNMQVLSRELLVTLQQKIV